MSLEFGSKHRLEGTNDIDEKLWRETAERLYRKREEKEVKESIQQLLDAVMPNEKSVLLSKVATLRNKYKGLNSKLDKEIDEFEKKINDSDKAGTLDSDLEKLNNLYSRLEKVGEREISEKVAYNDLLSKISKLRNEYGGLDSNLDEDIDRFKKKVEDVYKARALLYQNNLELFDRAYHQAEKEGKQVIEMRKAKEKQESERKRQEEEEYKRVYQESLERNKRYQMSVKDTEEKVTLPIEPQTFGFDKTDEDARKEKEEQLRQQQLKFQQQQQVKALEKFNFWKAQIKRLYAWNTELTNKINEKIELDKNDETRIYGYLTYLDNLKSVVSDIDLLKNKIEELYYNNTLLGNENELYSIYREVAGVHGHISDSFNREKKKEEENNKIEVEQQRYLERKQQEEAELSRRYQKAVEIKEKSQNLFQNINVAQDLANVVSAVRNQKADTVENNGKSSSEIDVDLEDFAKQERQILNSKHFTDDEKKQMIKELYEEFDNYVEENPEHNKTR